MPAQRKNTHQTHYEDLIVLGTEGLAEFDNKIESFIGKDIKKGSKTKLNLTTKIDGSPAVICWSKFEGYPDNSICLKSFISGANNAISDEKTIQRKYGDRPEMMAKLLFALKLAKYIPAGEAWQGDCLFTQETLRDEKINGKEYFTFQPNKIIYAIPKDSESAPAIEQAEFGVAFHTIYKDAGEGEKSQSFDVDLDRVNAPSWAYLMTVSLVGDDTDYDTSEIEDYYEKFKQVESQLIDDKAYQEICENEEFMSFWQTFENREIADKRSVTINEESFVEDILAYVEEKSTGQFNKKFQSLKTKKGQAKAYDSYLESLQALVDLIENNSKTLTNMVSALNLAARIKMSIWKIFKGTKSGYDTFYNTKSQGIIPASMEGVAMSDSEGNIVKIVDRTEFSAANRSDDYIAGWEHNKESAWDAFRSILDEGLKRKEYYIEKPRIVERYKRARLREAIEDGNTIVFAFGRMNPPTIGHLKLVKKLEEVASQCSNVKARLYLSHSCDAKKNPLSYRAKLQYADMFFGKFVDIADSDASNIFQIMPELQAEGFTNVIYVCGSDRVEEFSASLKKYNGVEQKNPALNYSFNSIEIVSAGQRDADSDDASSKASGTYVRQLACEGNYEEFCRYIPTPRASDGSLIRGDDIKRKLYNDIRGKLGVLNESVLSEAEDDGDEYVSEVSDEAQKKIDDITNQLKQFQSIADKIEDKIPIKGIDDTLDSGFFFKLSSSNGKQTPKLCYLSGSCDDEFTSGKISFYNEDGKQEQGLPADANYIIAEPNNDLTLKVHKSTRFSADLAAVTESIESLSAKALALALEQNIEVTKESLEEIATSNKVKNKTYKDWLSNWSLENVANQLNKFIKVCNDNPEFPRLDKQYEGCDRRDSIDFIKKYVVEARKALSLGSSNDNYTQADIVLYTPEGKESLNAAIESIKDSGVVNDDDNIPVYTGTLDALFTSGDIILISLKKPTNKPGIRKVGDASASDEVKSENIAAHEFMLGAKDKQPIISSNNSAECAIVLSDKNNQNYVCHENIRGKTSSNTVEVEMSGGDTKFARMGKITELIGATSPEVKDLIKSKSRQEIYEMIINKEGLSSKKPLMSELLKNIETYMFTPETKELKDPKYLTGAGLYLVLKNLCDRDLDLDALYYLTIRENYGDLNIFPTYIKLF